MRFVESEGIIRKFSTKVEWVLISVVLIDRLSEVRQILALRVSWGVFSGGYC